MKLQDAIDNWHLFDHHGHEDEAALLEGAARRVANLPDPDKVFVVALGDNISAGEMMLLLGITEDTR